MSKFFAGQPVRCVRSEGGNPHLVGMEARVIGPHLLGDSYEIDFPHPNGGVYWAFGHQLEPLIPPHEASEYTFHQLMDLLTAGEVANV
jgi:hypothetical protein